MRQSHNTHIFLCFRLFSKPLQNLFDFLCSPDKNWDSDIAVFTVIVEKYNKLIIDIGCSGLEVEEQKYFDFLIS